MLVKGILDLMILSELPDLFPSMIRSGGYLHGMMGTDLQDPDDSAIPNEVCEYLGVPTT